MLKLLFADYNELDGTSYVKIATNYGNFEGYAYISPEDKEIASSFLGCEIAEYRAIIKYFQKRISKLNIEINTLEDLKQAFIKKYKEDYHECELLEKKLKEKQHLKREFKENIKSLRKLINDKIQNRIIIINKMKEKKSNKKK